MKFAKINIIQIMRYIEKHIFNIINFMNNKLWNRFENSFGFMPQIL
jgi:hypothetical protein